MSERLELSDRYWKQPIYWNKEAIEAGERRRVFCGSMCDVFEHRDDLITRRRRLFNLIEETPQLDWLLLTKRPENIWPMIYHDWQQYPPKNVWYGTTVESDEYQRRIIELIDVPAVCHFLSCEPMLGEINVAPYVTCRKVDWVICGGESGPRARWLDMNNVRKLRDQCQEHKIAFYMKQLSEADSKEFKDFDTFPEDLQIREFPKP